MPKTPKTKPAAKRKPAATPTVLPEWLAETPYDVAYRLCMRDSGDGDYTQVIELTRKEFLILKVCVAKLRGITIPERRPEGLESRIGAGDPVWLELTPEEIAAVKMEAAHA